MLNKPESEENEKLLTSYVKIVDGIQVMTMNANEFTFTSPDIHIKA